MSEVADYIKKKRINILMKLLIFGSCALFILIITIKLYNSKFLRCFLLAHIQVLVTLIGRTNVVINIITVL